MFSTANLVMIALAFLAGKVITMNLIKTLIAHLETSIGGKANV